CHFLSAYVRAEMSVSDIFAALDLKGSDVNRSYWWQSTHQLSSHGLIVHHGLPDQQLFKQLFVDFASPSPSPSP
ncbi:MAG TPA: hypothetical protein VGE32_08330, partial [Cellvibrio sp.]